MKRLVCRGLSMVVMPALALAQQPAELPLKLAPRPTTAEITAADAMTRLYIFADDSMLGRRVGTIGNYKGTAYIEREVRKLGLTPGGDSGTYFQNLPVVVRTFAANQKITVDGKSFRPFEDFLPRDNGDFGLAVREIDGAQVVYGGVWGDTATMLKASDVAGKFVILSIPPGPDGKPRWQANRGMLTQFWLGARAIAVASYDVIDPQSRAALSDPSARLKREERAGPAGPAFLYITHAMANDLLGASMAGMARGAAGKTVHGTLKYDEAPGPARNVVAILPGSDPVLRNEYVAIGAHNDHVGFDHAPVDHDSLRAYNTVMRPGGAESEDRPATSDDLARVRAVLDSLRKIHKPRLDSIYNGADDDGSGSVGVLEIAEAFAKSPTKPKRSILFVWHAGEEAGLWGSEYFTDHPTVPRDSIVAQLNIDMIGRGGAADLPGGGPGYLQLIGSHRLSTELGDLVERVAKTEKTPFKFDYQYDANGHPQQYYCRSDHYEYARYGIPIVFFSTGGHRDYHQLTDEPQYIDYDQLARVAQLVHDLGEAVANLDHRVVVDHPKPDPKGACRQ